jgi:hypothetical protein
VAHVVVGGAGCEEMAYPSDQGVQQPGEADGAAACARWCGDARVRASFGDAQEPCRYCEGAAPVYVSDQYAAGTMSIEANGDLTWQLLLAPSGAVLDSFTITAAAARTRAAAAAAAARL